MKINLDLTPAEARELYMLAKNTEVCDLASEAEQKRYARMCKKVMESTSMFFPRRAS